MFDCHIHSFFSGDSKMSMEKGCNAAINKGLSEIIFTDHIDYEYPDTCEEIFEIDLQKYEDEIERVRKLFLGRIKVLKGVEMGIQKEVFGEIRKTVSENRFDMVIGSIHVLDKMELHSGDFSKGKTKYEAYRMYFEKTLDILGNFDDFDILGHLDIIRRYGNYAEKSLRYKDFADVVDKLLLLLVSKGKGLEINTSGFRYGLEDPMPSFEFIKRYFELGGEVLTLGSDAHRAEDIGFKLDFARDMAKSAGFRFICSFENRKAVFHKI